VTRSTADVHNCAMKYIALSSAVASAVLSGCFASTPKQFESVAKSVTPLTVGLNYQAAYRKVLTNGRNCWSAGMITATSNVTGNLYTDIKKGSVEVGIHGGLGTMLVAVIDVEALDDVSTRVTVSERNGKAAYAERVKGWFNGASDSCE
jgi:hypothetical protein